MIRGFESLLDLKGKYSDTYKRMKLMDIYRRLNEDKSLQRYEDIFKFSPDEIVDYFGLWDGFNDREDAVEEIEYLMDTELPEGFKNIPPVVDLYRVLLIGDGEAINEDEIGIHFIADPDFIEPNWLINVGVWDAWHEEVQGYLLKCKVRRSDINFKDTISNRLTYPREYEYTLHRNSKVKIVYKEKMNRQNYGK